MNSKEQAFTWLSRCCYGRKATQTIKPLSLSRAHVPIFSLSLLLLSLLPSLPESLAGWKNQTANEGTQLLNSLPPPIFIFLIASLFSFILAPLKHQHLPHLHFSASVCFSNIRMADGESCSSSTQLGTICQQKNKNTKTAAMQSLPACSST